MLVDWRTERRVDDWARSTHSDYVSHKPVATCCGQQAFKSLSGIMVKPPSLLDSRPNRRKLFADWLLGYNAAKKLSSVKFG